MGVVASSVEHFDLVVEVDQAKKVAPPSALVGAGVLVAVVVDEMEALHSVGPHRL